MDEGRFTKFGAESLTKCLVMTTRGKFRFAWLAGEGDELIQDCRTISTAVTWGTIRFSAVGYTTTLKDYIKRRWC